MKISEIGAEAGKAVMEKYSRIKIAERSQTTSSYLTDKDQMQVRILLY